MEYHPTIELTTDNSFFFVLQKEIVYNQIRQLWLPYTLVDVGWWYQLSYPRLPSGRVDYAMTSGNDEIIGDGNVTTALTDLRDIGRYMALIINDPRTLNKKVLAYNLVSSQNDIYSLMEEIAEEKIDRNYVCSDYCPLPFRKDCERTNFDVPEHRSPKKPFAAECWRPDKPVKPTHSTPSNLFPVISPNTNTPGAFGATTTRITPGTSDTT